MVKKLCLFLFIAILAGGLFSCEGGSGSSSNNNNNNNENENENENENGSSSVAPGITTQPANQVATFGKTATFSVTATGTDPLKYQWKKDDVDIDGATSASYTISAISAADIDSDFTVTVSNNTGTITSNSATLILLSTLNDTGVSQGGNYHSNTNSDCSSNVDSPQDCHQGKDALAAENTLTKVGSGNGGFDFTKLDSSGSELESSATSWSCVRDNHTGLVWEVKTNTTGLHNKNDSYSWYSSTEVSHKGDQTDDSNPDTCEGYNSNDSSTYCNTEAFVKRVNATGLCGVSNWRMPSMAELRDLVDYSSSGFLTIDTQYFPHASRDFYWSDSPVLYVQNGGHYTRRGVYFTNGDDAYASTDNPLKVRLVSGSQLLSNDWSDERYIIDHGNETVVDTKTGLMWARCALGQSSYYCEQGTPTTHDWKEALQQAENATIGGYSDWRLPNVKELSSLVALVRAVPAINVRAFPHTKFLHSSYWTSSPKIENADYSWVVDFSYGLNKYKYHYRSYDRYVRLVRGAQ